MRRDDLDRLLKLRRERERRAEEEVRQARAERDARERARAEAWLRFHRHEAERRAHCARLYAALAGRRMSVAEFDALTATIDAWADQSTQLHKHADAASAALEQAENAVEGARRVYAARRLESARCAEAAAQRATVEGRRSQLLAEVEADEIPTRRRSSALRDVEATP